MRRNFLRIEGFGMAAAAIPVVSFAASTQKVVPVTAIASQGIFDVRKYGATGDGKTLDTQAVNRAIEAASSAGGGVVGFPAGTYLCFSIRLKSQVHLQLLQGSIILAADSPLPSELTGYRSGVYDAAEPKTVWDVYQDYGHNHWYNSLIWGKGLSNGRGCEGDGAPFIVEPAGVGNKAIALKNCRNVLLCDFAILKGGHFGLLLTGVDNLTIDNLIDTDRDGMDIDCCQNVRVSNCTVNSPWDDGICPKSSFALGYA
jgi:polygalacturonase